MAVYMLTTARKGVPSTQLARELGVTQKTVWFLAHRIREAWLSQLNSKGMGPIAEVDETYIGGKEKNRHGDRKARVGRGPVGNQAVAGMVERGGRVSAGPVRNTSSAALQKFITNHAQPGATVCTDSLKAHKGLKGYKHEGVNHGVGEFVPGWRMPTGSRAFGPC